VGGRNESERAATQRAGGRISWNEDVEFTAVPETGGQNLFDSPAEEGEGRPDRATAC
jgi:hypothetical protein